MLKEFVLIYCDCILGVLSGGRGTLSMCGGVSNPVHHTRYAFSFK